MKIKSKDSPNLDLLRTVAVLCVFVSHLRHFVTGQTGEFEWHLGQLGVLMFFVHTSLVLMMSLERMGAASARLFGSFYIRRIFRIYPLSIFSLLVVFFTHFQPEVGHGVHLWTVRDLFTNLTLTQNLFYADDMLLVLWSLPLEVQMYLFLPFLFLFARASRPRLLFWLWCACVVLGVAQPHISGRLSVIGYAPCFVPGVIAWRLIRPQRRQAPGFAWPPALMAVSCIWFVADRAHNMYFRWIFCLLLGMIIPYFSEIPFHWLRAGCKTIAKYSYGIYLTHLFTMAIAFTVLRHPVAQWITFAGLSVLLPYLAYRLIEHPGIWLGRRIAARIERAVHQEERPVTTRV